jgi:hypothetical protein
MNKNDYSNLPLDVKISKENKFTEKRNPYKKYLKAKWEWIDIFLEIECLKDEPKFLKNISQKYNINYKTLKNKYNKFKNDENYNNIDNENRGVKKFFTDNEEREIFIFLKENFIDKNKVLCNDIIKIHAQEKFKKLYPEEIFKASNGWCNIFKKRWNLSTVKITISKIATKVYTDDEINLFLKDCKDSLLEVGENFFSI